MKWSNNLLIHLRHLSQDFSLLSLSFFFSVVVFFLSADYVFENFDFLLFMNVVLLHVHILKIELF